MKEKNIGINLLRIYAVLSVVILHFLGHGGVLANTLINSSQYKLSWLLEIMAYPAVNIFGLISGYVYYNNGKVKKVFFSCFKLWVSIVFYCLIITLLFDIFSSIDIKPIDYLKALFPIANRPYWYFTAYFGLSIFMPIISKGLESIDDNKSRKLFMLIIIVFSFYDRIPNVMGMEYGYCVAWLLVLFILGALIKKCNIGYKMNNYVIAISIICSTDRFIPIW